MSSYTSFKLCQPLPKIQDQFLRVLPFLEWAGTCPQTALIHVIPCMYILLKSIDYFLQAPLIFLKNIFISVFLFFWLFVYYMHISEVNYFYCSFKKKSCIYWILKPTVCWLNVSLLRINISSLKKRNHFRNAAKIRHPVWESRLLCMNVSASLSFTYSSLEVGYMKITFRKPETNIHLFLILK